MESESASKLGIIFSTNAEHRRHPRSAVTFFRKRIVGHKRRPNVSAICLFFLASERQTTRADYSANELFVHFWRRVFRIDLN